MIRILVFSFVALLLAGCTGNSLRAQNKPLVVASGEAVQAPAKQTNGQLEFQLDSGVYQCELGMKVHVQRDPMDRRLIRLGWTNSEYQLRRDDSSSGLPRYQDLASGLVWIDLPWKGVLLDGRKNRPIASDCVLAAK